MAEVQAHRTTVSASTNEIRRELALGDRVMLLVEGVVTSVGVRRASDGDIEVRGVKALDVVEVPAGDERIVDLVTTAREDRRKAADEAAGRLGLFDTPDPQFVVGLDCGHDARYPEDWREREEHAEAESLTDALRFWEAQQRPVEFGPSACPICDRETDGAAPSGSAVALSVVQAANTLSGLPDGAQAEEDGASAGDPDEHSSVPPWETYDDDAPKLIRDRLTKANAAHVLAYEKANRDRWSVTGPAKNLVTAAQSAAEADDEERF